jgi:hypothetical protein
MKYTITIRPGEKHLPSGRIGALYQFYSEAANTDAASTVAKETGLDTELALEWRLGVRYCVAFAFIMSEAFSAIAYVGPIKCAHRPMGMTETISQ